MSEKQNVEIIHTNYIYDEIIKIKNREYIII